MSTLADTDDAGFSKKVKRPATIEIRFADKARFDQAAALYCLLLGAANPTTPTSTTCQLRLVGDIELLLIYDATLPGPENSTVVFWEVPGKLHTDIEAVYTDLINLQKFTGLKPPKAEPTPPGRPITERALLKDNSGNLFGLTINPPFP